MDIETRRRKAMLNIALFLIFTVPMFYRAKNALVAIKAKRTNR